MNIPVYITNKNWLTPVRRLVKWLLWANGVGNITILDNGSTYEPLLDYYQKVGANPRVKVEMLGEQESLGWVFWAQGREKLETGPYIVTDGDQYPAPTCPVTLVETMHDVLQEYYSQGFWKVGPSLRTENLPDSPWKNEVVTSQEQYHKDRIAPHLFRSAIDTTFAIYMKGFGNQEIGRAIRLAPPCVFEHYPWYVWPLDDEAKFYCAHDSYMSGHTSNLRRKGLL